jgi:hypothetical protein
MSSLKNKITHIFQQLSSFFVLLSIQWVYFFIRHMKKKGLKDSKSPEIICYYDLKTLFR